MHFELSDAVTQPGLKGSGPVKAPNEKRLSTMYVRTVVPKSGVRPIFQCYSKCLQISRPSETFGA